MGQKWGYRADGAARIFDLEDGESLPDGWSDTPEVIADEDKRSAEAISEALKNPIDDAAEEIETVAVGEVRKRRGRPPKMAQPEGEAA